VKTEQAQDYRRATKKRRKDQDILAGVQLPNREPGHQFPDLAIKLGADLIVLGRRGF